MKQQRKLIVRNLVIAMIAADAAGIYYLHDRLTKPAPESTVTIDDEAIAAAAEVHFKPQTQAGELHSASDAPPRPAFGQEDAKLALAKAGMATSGGSASAQNSVPSAPLAPDATPRAAAPAQTVKARLAFAPRAVAAPKPAPVYSVTAPALTVAGTQSAAKSLPRAGFVESVRRPTVLSVAAPIPDRVSKVAAAAQAPTAKHRSFKKAFAGFSQPASPAALGMSAPATSASASVVSANYAPEHAERLPPSAGITSQAMAISQSADVTEAAPVRDLSGPAQPAATSGELPSVDE